MPTAPPKACRCGGRITDGRCSKCGPRRRDTRKHAAARGYDYQWQKFRLYYLAYHPLCKDCEEQGIVTAATDVHHKQKLCDRPDLKYEPSNLKSLCDPCHNKRTALGE